MREAIYPSLDEALYLHRLLIEEFGGDSTVLDLGLLESALARPRSGYYSSLSEQAAALMQSIAMNHPFADGNKRMAFAMAAIFLKLNSYKLTVGMSAGRDFIENRLIKSRASLEEIAGWIESRIQRV